MLCIQELSCFPVRMERYGQELPLLSNLVGEDNLLIHAALDMAREGDVIVVSNEGGVDNRSLMGEIMFTYAAYKKS